MKKEIVIDEAEYFEGIRNGTVRPEQWDSIQYADGKDDLHFIVDLFNKYDVPLWVGKQHFGMERQPLPHAMRSEMCQAGWIVKSNQGNGFILDNDGHSIDIKFLGFA